jgi:hypothetical protein
MFVKGITIKVEFIFAVVYKAKGHIIFRDCTLRQYRITVTGTVEYAFPYGGMEHICLKSTFAYLMQVEAGSFDDVTQKITVKTGKGLFLYR